MSSTFHVRKVLVVALILVVMGLAGVGSYFTFYKPTTPYIVTSMPSGTTPTSSNQTTKSETTIVPTQWLTVGQVKSTDYYLSLLESNGTTPYVQLATELRKLPDLQNATAVATITYLALNATNPEVKEAFQLMLQGGTPDPRDFQYPAPQYNTELQVLYWTASQRQFKHDDTLALAISISNGFWVTIGDDSVRQQVRKDAADLLDFFRETDLLQQNLGYSGLEQLPLEAKIALTWLGGDTGTHGPHAITGSQTKQNDLNTQMDLVSYEWDNVNITTLRQMRDYVKKAGWLSSNTDQTAGTIEDYFFFSGFNQHFKYVSYWDVTIQVNGETVPVRNMNNANFNFAYYLRNGQAIGVCEDEMTLVSAFLKSWGIATLPMLAYWFAGTTNDPRDVAYSVGGNWYSGHTYTMYFDAGSKSWKVFPLQIGMVFPYVRDAYIFLPPVLQNEFLPSSRTPPSEAAVSYPFQSGEVNTNMFAPMFNITGTYLIVYKRGVASAEMKQWVLYKSRPPSQPYAFTKWDYNGPWKAIQDGSKDLENQNGSLVGDLGQPYVDLANVSYSFSNGSLFFRFATRGNIPSDLASHVGGFWYQVLLDTDSDSITGYHWSNDFTPDYLLAFSVGIDPSTNAPSVYSDLSQHCGGPQDWCWASVGFTQQFGRTPLILGGVGKDYFVLTCAYQDISISSGSVIRFFARSGINYDNKVYNDQAPDNGTVTATVP